MNKKKIIDKKAAIILICIPYYFLIAILLEESRGEMKVLSAIILASVYLITHTAFAKFLLEKTLLFVMVAKTDKNSKKRVKKEITVSTFASILPSCIVTICTLEWHIWIAMVIALYVYMNEVIKRYVGEN